MKIIKKSGDILGGILMGTLGYLAEIDQYS